MKLKVFYYRENREISVDLDTNSSVKDLLEKMNINPVSVIVSRNNELAVEDEKINEKDNIRVISVISGG